MSPNASQKHDTKSLTYVSRSGIAGGVAGCIAKTAVAPLDRVKILFQASNPEFQKYAGTWSGVFVAGKEIFKENGIRGLLQGHSATLLRVFPYAAIKFMVYDQIHPLLMPTHESETNIRRFIAGSISGTSSVFFTYPLELLRVRLAFQTRPANWAVTTPFHPSLRQAISDIYHEGQQSRFPISSSANAHSASSTTASLSTPIFARFPILSFYRGFTVTLIGMIPYAGSSFVAWGYLRALLLPPPPRKPTPIADLAIGATAGCISQTVSYPFEVVRRRMQVGGLTQPDRWLTFTETISAIYSKHGWRGFYVGLSIGYMKIIPMTAISFTAWEGMKRLLDI